MTQSHIVDAIKRRCGRVMHATNSDIALAVTCLPAGNESVRHHHSASWVLYTVSSNPIHRGGQHIGVRAVDPKCSVHNVGVEIRNRIDVQITVLV